MPEARPAADVARVLSLARRGLSGYRIARLTGIPRSTVQRWRTGRTPSSGRRSLQDCPRCGEGSVRAESYAYLLGLYLGDGYIAGPRPGVYSLRVVLDERYPGIIAECAEAIAECRPPEHMAVHRRRRTGCVEVFALWKHWPCLFPQHGPGPKHGRPIRLEAWQEATVVRRPGRFLRGLIHSDGWRGMNRVKGRPYPRYQFVNHSEEIRGLFCWACDLYGVGWRRMSWKAISIARAADVARLDEEVGPKA
jgi:hypothetical protein